MEKITEISVRKPLEADARRILAVSVECGFGWTLEDYITEIRRYNSILLIAETVLTEGGGHEAGKGKMLTGFAAARLSGVIDDKPKAFGDFPELDIINFGVAKAYRRQGIGELLFARLMEDAALQAVRDIWLEVRETNYGAIEFYRRLGFAITQVRRNFYENPSDNALLLKFSRRSASIKIS